MFHFIRPPTKLIYYSYALLPRSSEAKLKHFLCKLISVNGVITSPTALSLAEVGWNWSSFVYFSIWE